MNKIIKNLIITGLLLITITPTKAQNFFDTSEATSFFTFSIRAGFNTSNRTFPSGHYNVWNQNNWGLGLNGGIMANLNFREYLTIQPGLFLESRSGNFTYLTEYLDRYQQSQTHYEMGHIRGYYVTVPIMALIKFNLATRIQWSVEFGPYFQFEGRDYGQNNIPVIYRLPQENDYNQYKAELNKFDIGLKVGTGLKFYNHYYVGVHYLAGFYNAWKKPEGGKNKSWQFTIGYDF